MKVSPNTLFMYKTTLKRIVHTSFHFILDNVLISQYLSGLFNLFLRPLKPQRDVWDVNQVLLYWDCQPFNKDLPLMMLLQKAVMLILISTMHRHAELLAMNLDNVVYYPNCMVFPLDRSMYPKTYSMYNKLEDL